MNKRSIKGQLTLSLGILMVVLALLKFLVSLILVLAVTGNINSYAESYVSDQIIRHSGVLLNQTSNLMVNYLNSSTNGLIQPIVYSISNIYRSGFIFINDVSTNYFDWDLDTLSQPVEYSTRQQKIVSLINSAYYLPNVVQSDLPTLPTSTKEAIGETNYLDEIWIPLYDRYEDFVNVYIGLSSTGLFRKYPGVNTSQTDRSYDPRQRGWYTQAVANQGQTIITTPYPDARGLGDMITFAQTFQDSSGAVVGVAGGDLLIKTLVDSIQKINLYETGNMILIQTDKTIIVNKDGDTSFLDLIDFTVEYEQPQTVSDGTYVYIYQRIKEYGGKYILIAKVDSSEIQAPLQTVNDKMKNTKVALILILLGIFLGILALTVILIILVVRGIVRPLEDIVRISDDIVNDIGKGSQKKAVNAKNNQVANIAEVEEFRDRIIVLKNEIEKSRQNNANQMRMENKYFGKPSAEIPWVLS